MQKIKTNDQVIVITGKDKGKIGTVKEVFDDRRRIVVEGVNMVKKHLRSNPQQPDKPGGIVDREAPLSLSNVALVNPKTNKADKVGFKFVGKEHRKVRVFKSNGEVIDV